jgi:hypothetical protein
MRPAAGDIASRCIAGDNGVGHALVKYDTGSLDCFKVEEINNMQKRLLHDILLFVMVRVASMVLYASRSSVQFPNSDFPSNATFSLFVVVKYLCNLGGPFSIRLLFFGTIAELILLQI